MLFGRRVTFTILVLISELLLIGAAIAWCLHMFLIAKHGQVYFVEENSAILYGEIVATAIIAIFACIVFALQWKRLGEKRRGDDREKGTQG